MDLKAKSFAVVGASNNSDKYGFRVVEALKKISGKVFPVNPKETQILGLKVFKTVNEIMEKVDVVVFVVPPAVTLDVMGNLVKFKPKKQHYWFQPGSFDEKVIDYCLLNGITYTDDKCIIVESEKQLI